MNDSSLISSWTQPRRLWLLACAGCLGMFAGALWMQHGLGLEPCPMCVVQRYALVAVALFTGLAAWGSGRGVATAAATLPGTGTGAAAGAAVVSRSAGVGGGGAVWARIAGALGLLAAGFGAFVAARQSWLQWYPPEIASCGRDFYGMVEAFPLQRAIPMIFRGSGDCSKIDFTFLGLSIANWSFVAFCGLALVALVALLRRDQASGI